MNIGKVKYLCVAILTGLMTTSVHGAYQYGDTGEELLPIQKQLISAGYKARETGEYDANTKWAVRLYQQDHNLPVDGILDSRTYKELMGKELPSNPQVVSKVQEILKKDEALAKKGTEKKKETKLSKTNSSNADVPTVDSSSTAVTTSTIKNKTKQVVSKKEKKEDTKAKKKNDKKTKVKKEQKKKANIDTSHMTGDVKTVLTYANTFTGVPYKFGGTTPAGFDCSGYTRHVFKKVGVQLPRQADEQYRVGKKVEKKNLQPGDLVFFETYEPGVSHSGIYVGDGQFISATSSSGVAIASINDSYWGPRYVGAKRVL